MRLKYEVKYFVAAEWKNDETTMEFKSFTFVLRNMDSINKRAHTPDAHRA